MEPKTAVQQLVDEMLEHARMADPGLELTITLSQVNSLLLPLHGRELHRFVGGRYGSYRSPVYRDCMVWDLKEHPDELVVVVSVPQDGDTAPPRYCYGDLSDGLISDTIPERFLTGRNGLRDNPWGP